MAKKTTKKVTKPIAVATKAIRVPAKESKDILSHRCPACNGTGLERSTFTNSPICIHCKGAGLIS